MASIIAGTASKAAINILSKSSTNSIACGCAQVHITIPQPQVFDPIQEVMTNFNGTRLHDVAATKLTNATLLLPKSIALTDEIPKAPLKVNIPKPYEFDPATQSVVKFDGTCLYDIATKPINTTEPAQQIRTITTITTTHTKNSKINQAIQESAIAKILREEKASALRLQDIATRSSKPAQQVRTLTSLITKSATTLHTITALPIVQAIQESKLAKSLRESKGATLPELKVRQVQGRVRDSMGTPMSFISKKLMVFKEARAKEEKKRVLESSCRAAVEAAKKGDEEKMKLLDACFV